MGFNLLYIQTIILYCTGNTLHLGCKNQLVNVIKGNNHCFFLRFIQNTDALCGQGDEFCDI